VPGGNPGHLFNPDDAMMTPADLAVPADIKNCRLVVITPTRVIGQTTTPVRKLRRGIRQPNGAIPSDPDEVDLVPRESLLITHAATMGQP